MSSIPPIGGGNRVKPYIKEVGKRDIQKDIQRNQSINEDIDRRRGKHEYRDYKR